MCGLAGTVLARSGDRANEKILLAMRDAQRHRGPDEAGLYLGQGAGHPEVKALMAECAQRVNALGLACGTVMGDAEQAAWAFEAGYRFVAIGTDMGLLCSSARKAQREVRQRRQG